MPSRVSRSNFAVMVFMVAPLRLCMLRMAANLIIYVLPRTVSYRILDTALELLEDHNRIVSNAIHLVAIQRIVLP
jgi:hypothetical protein